MGELSHTRQLDSMSGKEFENLIAQLIRKLGFEIESQSTGPDGGIDILASSEADLVSGRYVIQCKRYSKKVGVGAVRDLFGVVSDKRVNKGILITNAEFTTAAVEFADGNPIELIGGPKLSVLLEKHLGEIFRPGDEGMTLPPSLVSFVKFISIHFGRLKKLIDDQQVQIDKRLILIKPKSFLSLEDQSGFFTQHWDDYGRMFKVFINKLEYFWGGESWEEDPEEIKRGFALVKKSLKELLRLQLEIHSVRPLGEGVYKRAFAQTKRIYSRLFETLSKSLGTLIESARELLESPERFIANEGQARRLEGLRRKKVGAEDNLEERTWLGLVYDIDLTGVAKEIEELNHMFESVQQTKTLQKGDTPAGEVSAPLKGKGVRKTTTVSKKGTGFKVLAAILVVWGACWVQDPHLVVVLFGSIFILGGVCLWLASAMI